VKINDKKSQIPAFPRYGAYTWLLLEELRMLPYLERYPNEQRPKKVVCFVSQGKLLFIG